ncbi:MAG: NAD-dependent epimerase/dehydratase family protein [Sinimarinibacterium sp.]|jgi:UDP-glucose 4-epimerase
MNAATVPVLVTGAAGLVGRALVETLARDPRWRVIASDLRAPADWLAQVPFIAADLLTADWPALLREHGVERVVHLAAVVATQAGRAAERVHAIEVGGTQTLFAACHDAGVRQFIVASSGAAYGYAADLPVPVAEDFPLRPHPDFPYAAHKAEIEHWLAAQPAPPATLVLRLCTVLAPGRSTPVTALFERAPMLGLRGHDSPFCFVHRDDVVGAIVAGLEREASGTYNVSGDGWLTLDQIAVELGARIRRLPPALLRAGLRVAHALRLSGFSAGQVDFLAYRPVLDNARLKTQLGYVPKYSSQAAFTAWRKARDIQPGAPR